MPPILNLESVSVNRGKTVMLKDVSWEIKEGEHWALIGPNGSGKTTLLKIVSGYLWPSSGKVHVLGKEFGKTDIRELRKKIGWVSSYLMEKLPENDSPVDIVVSGKFASFGVYEKITNEDRKKASAILEFLGCGYIKDRSITVLSQGERQKILIARALMADPMILLLDEPCTGLDMKARQNMLDSVSKICRENKATIIYVTHHINEIVPEIKNVLLLKEGREFMKGKKSILNKKNLDRLFE